jgi:hypothetical protein
MVFGGKDSLSNFNFLASQQKIFIFWSERVDGFGTRHKNDKFENAPTFL